MVVYCRNMGFMFNLVRWILLALLDVKELATRVGARVATLKAKCSWSPINPNVDRSSDSSGTPTALRGTTSSNCSPPRLLMEPEPGAPT